MILTSNKSFGEWGEIAGDSVLTTMMLDRLLHHPIIFNLKGEKLSITGKEAPTRKTEESMKSFWGIAILFDWI
jgi:DNA replication protein DnaC